MRAIRPSLVHLLVALLAFLYMGSAYCATKQILVLGDSLSAGYGLPNDTGWVSLLEKRLKSEKIAGTVVNASISGETTAGGKTRLPALLERHPDVVIIELGGNDALRGLSLAASEANLDAMISSSQAHGAKVLLVGMQIPPNFGTDYAKRFVDLFPKLAQRHQAACVPFLLAGLEHRRDLFQADGIHPVADAQTMLLDNVWGGLKPLIKS